MLVVWFTGHLLLSSMSVTMILYASTKSTTIITSDLHSNSSTISTTVLFEEPLRYKVSDIGSSHDDDDDDAYDMFATVVTIE